MEIEITKLSSKGQIVIPISMRKGFDEGEKIVLIKADDKIILKKASKMDEQFSEDIEFARRTEEARKRIETGKYISVDSKNLVEEMMKW
ncbi:MAG: AbrB/MazE/SpoVT family DNA-binding domain-containing protein [Nanoarchaeota archaeon]|nr:AbrB/MazE/SpoVT family DNA-binding domain-containing protein [Nanoarchaeota archaeon]